MNIARKILRRLRGHLEKRDTSRDWIILAAAKRRKQDFWERDRQIVRNQNFRKAQLVRRENIERARDERETEEERLAAIEEVRLKNLKKARRKLRNKRRLNESQD